MSTFCIVKITIVKEIHIKDISGDDLLVAGVNEKALQTKSNI